MILCMLCIIMANIAYLELTRYVTCCEKNRILYEETIQQLRRDLVAANHERIKLLKEKAGNSNSADGCDCDCDCDDDLYHVWTQYHEQNPVEETNQDERECEHEHVQQ